MKMIRVIKKEIQLIKDKNAEKKSVKLKIKPIKKKKKIKKNKKKK